MRPEVVHPVRFQGGIDVEILELGEGEEGGCGYNIDAQDLCEAMAVEVEGSL